MDMLNTLLTKLDKSLTKTTPSSVNDSYVYSYEDLYCKSLLLADNISKLTFSDITGELSLDACAEAVKRLYSKQFSIS